LNVPPPAGPDRFARFYPVTFALALAALLVATVALPIYQLLRGRGLLYYENGFDESSYLQYDFSRAVQSAARPGQYLVTWAHDLGLSGGYINFLADILTFVAFPCIVWSLFRRIGWSGFQASLGALLVVVGPQLVTPSNPIIQAIHEWTLRSGMIYWITLPIAPFSPLARTPEPQFSLLLLGVAMLVALRWRTFWPVFATIPFMYPFVAIPVAFVALACQLRAWWPAGASRFATVGPLALAFGAIGAACWGYHAVVMAPAARLAVTQSHLPLLPVTSVVAIVLYVALRRHIAPEYRFFALALALASWVGTNQQVISGFVPQPYSFEYYVGVFAAAVVAALGLKERPRWLMAGVLAGTSLFMVSSYQTYRLYQGYMIRLPLTEELSEALRQDAARVVVNDGGNASLLNLVHPRQAATALAYDRTYPVVSAGYIDAYRCVKRQIRADYGPAFDPVLRPLDNAYAFGSQDFIFGTLNRTTSFRRLHDVSAAACRDTAPLELRYFFVNWFPPPERVSRRNAAATSR
jgi:hypothetical protein